MPNGNEVQSLVGQRRYTRRQVLNGFGAGAITLSAAYLRACNGCRPTPPSVVVVGSVLKVRPKDRPSGLNDAKLLAAKNEFESFQIVIQAGSNPLRNVNVALSTPLSGPGGSTIPAKNITIYREDCYEVTVKSDQEGDTGPWPDALIPAQDPWHGHPRNAFPIDVPANENRVAWIDVLVPQEAAPGQYSGSIKVTATDFNANVPIQLADQFCQARYGASCIDEQHQERYEEGWRLNALLAAVALDNRITIANPWYQPPVGVDLPLFRKHTLPLLNGTAPTRLPGAKLTSLQADVGSLAAWRDEAQNFGVCRSNVRLRRGVR